MTRAFGWGILGPGRIAMLTTRGPLVNLPDVRRVAVGSRSKDRAAEFAARFGFARSYGSYEELANDPNVEIVYVATPHPFHREHTILCLEHGKHVVCEKPMAMNEREVREMVECARANGRFLVEAMFTRWLPVHRAVKGWIADGRIGEVRMLWASSGFIAGWDPQSRILNKELGGGALLDIGVYPVALAHSLFGSPARVCAAGYIGTTGVDEQEACVFQYANGQLASLSSSVRTRQRNDAVIQGTQGQIYLAPSWWGGPRTGYLQLEGEKEPLHFQETEKDWLYEAGNPGDHEKSWMVAHVMDCLREGRLESPDMPLDESVATARSMDQIRAQIGLTYPADLQ